MSVAGNGVEVGNLPFSTFVLWVLIFFVFSAGFFVLNPYVARRAGRRAGYRAPWSVRRMLRRPRHGR